MLLDQQVAMETAFSGPLKIAQRIGTVDAAAIAAYDPDEFVEVFRQTPSVHRYPGSMAGRIQALCAALDRGVGRRRRGDLDAGRPGRAPRCSGA